jgi:UDP-glucose 4-epimerase
MMSLDDAVHLVQFAFSHAQSGDIFVQKSPAASVMTLAVALKDLLGVPDHPIEVIGTRHGEKRFEVLLSREEMAAAHDLGDYFKVPPDLRDLNYDKYVERGEHNISSAVEYNSDNTEQLDIEGMKSLLRKLPLISAYMDGRQVDAEA